MSREKDYFSRDEYNNLPKTGHKPVETPGGHLSAAEIKEMNWIKRTPRTFYTPPEKIIKMGKMLLAGKRIEEISLTLDINRRTVNRFIKRLGLGRMERCRDQQGRWDWSFRSIQRGKGQ
jgi:hypothetical protein